MNDTIKQSQARCAKAGHFLTSFTHGRRYCALCHTWLDREITETDIDTVIPEPTVPPMLRPTEAAW